MSLARRVKSRSFGAFVIVSLAAVSTLADEPRKSPVDAISVLSATPTPDAAKRWLAGDVRFDGDWATPDQVARVVANDPDEAAYRQRREKLPETADAHFRLAQWCRERGLADLQRAHLLVATQLDPTDHRSHRSLGLVAHNGTWMSQPEIAQSRRRESEALQAYDAWKTKLIVLRRELSSADPDVRHTAESQLSAVRDPLAIPALEEVISQVSEHNGMLVLETVGQMVHKAVTRSLVRHAVWHPSARVREAAVSELRHLDPDQYIGDLIHLMRPTASGETWTTLPNGTPAYVWFMQDYDRNYLTVALLDGRERYGPLDHKAPERPENRRLGIQSRAEFIEAKNQFRMQNAHSALKQITGEDHGMEQQAWVKWWQDVSYVSPNEYSKPHRTAVVRYEKIGVFDPTTASCFVAGTPVWTRGGLVPIDHVQLGELVLAKNIETGELAYQPVIDRTIRRRKPTLSLQLDGDMIGVTPGHAIWSAERGWTRARDLEAGDHLGTCGGSVQLVSSFEGEADFVYNLVVAGSNTYFVGRHRILVHDITPVADTVMTADTLSNDADE